MDRTLIYGLAALVFVLVVILVIIYSKYKKLKNGMEKTIKEAREEAQKAIQSKDTFLANVSHETRTPMNAIIGLSHILLQSDLNDEQKTNLFKIKRSAEHLLSITNDILDYSKLEAGKLTLESIPIDGSNFFSNLADIIAPLAIDKNLDLVFDIDPDIPEQWNGDPLRLSQILINLLNNAVKFTQEGYVLLKVTYTHDAKRPVLHFAVTDTGIGLTEDQQRTLFDAFSQADNSISRKFGGTGLGLSISAELTAMMGTHLQVESKIKEGSTFSFDLPLDPQSIVLHETDKLSVRLMEEKNILIVEKSAVNASLLATIFGHYRARPTIARSVEEMHRLLQYEHYHSVFIDSRLLQNPIDKERLKKHSDSVIILQYTLLPSSGNTLAADAVINKPFLPLTIQGTIAEIFGKTIVTQSVTKKHIGFDDILVLGGSRILLAEDNEGNAMVVEGLLEGSGIELVVAENGQKAVETLFKDPKPFDLILMDINMPVMDGYAATSIIREYQKYDDVPIIAMTANITESDMNKSKSYGMQDFIAKPVDVEHLYTTLLKYIEAKRKPAEVSPMKAEPSPSLQQAKPAQTRDDIPGLDIKEGISRLNGNRMAYEKILDKYVELFSDIDTKLANALHAEQFEEGRKLAHNLKGLSGNIGAHEIYRLAAETETAFKHEDAAALTELLATLKRDLGALLHAIKTRKPSQPAEKPRPKEAITPAALSGILESLRASALKKRAKEVKQGCAALSQYRLPPSLESEFKLMTESAQRYAYNDVLTHIDNMLKGLV